MSNILKPLEIVVAWIMVAWHTALTAVGLPPGGGWTWALSIVGLVIVIRIALIPLFVKQIKASRGLQLIQPEMKKIQAKYKGKSDPESRQAMSRETMELYRRTGTNPLSSCLPILLQSPIFFALFRVLNGIPKGNTVGPLNDELVHQADQATIFGARLSDTFIHAHSPATRVLTVVLIILMSLSTFTTQRQLMMKNMPAGALDNPFAQQQKILLYVMPLVFAVSGVNFPIGVLLYWLTTNVWSMGQQFYVIRRMPAPGSKAEQALNERRARRSGPAPELPPAPEDEKPSGQRPQPRRQQPRKKRRGPNPPKPNQPSDPGSPPPADGSAEESAEDDDEGEEEGPRASSA